MSRPSLPLLEDLQARIGTLERGQRRWRAATLTLGIVGLLAVLMGAIDLPRKLELEELTLRDSQGNPRLRLFLLNDHPHLVMLDADGIPRSQFSAEAIALHERGRPRMTLTSGGGRTPAIVLYDVDGKPKKFFEIGENDKPVSLRRN